MEQAIRADPEFRELERLREMARHNEASALRHARDEGKAEGRAEGMTQVAQKMKAMGFSSEQIQTATGLPAESIKKI
jgi:predicted transposase/invertase (TIGR01784 family)